MTCPNNTQPVIPPQQKRSLIHYLNLLGKHVRHGNITEYEARILLSTEVRPIDKGPIHDVLTHIDSNLERLLHNTPVKNFTIKYDDQKQGVSIVVTRRRLPASNDGDGGSFII